MHFAPAQLENLNTPPSLAELLAMLKKPIKCLTFGRFSMSCLPSVLLRAPYARPLPPPGLPSAPVRCTAACCLC